MTAVANIDLNKQVELYEGNNEPRCPFVLLLDTSGSMVGEPIDAANEGVANLAYFLKQDQIARNRVEPGVITYGGTVKVQTDFGAAEDFNPEVYEAQGGTPMGEGILTALKLIEERKNRYKAQGVEYYRPIILAITDGKPTDDNTFLQAVRALQEAEARKKVDFYAVGVLNADMALLKGMQTRQAPVYLKGVEFTTLFRYVSNSLSAESTEDGQIKLKLS